MPTISEYQSAIPWKSSGVALWVTVPVTVPAMRHWHCGTLALCPGHSVMRGTLPWHCGTLGQSAIFTQSAKPYKPLTWAE